MQVLQEAPYSLYHLGEDKSVLNDGKKISLSGSECLTININCAFYYRSEKWLFDFVLAAPQLWGRYQLNRRLQLFAFMPYQYNLRRDDTSDKSSDGVGVISALLNILLINKNESDSEWRQHLTSGIGFKTPTGAYAGITDLDRGGIPNLQLGTGSRDFIANLNYTLTYENFGINTDVS